MATQNVYITRPGGVITCHANGRSWQVDPLEHYAYDRLARELNDVDGLRATLIEENSIVEDGAAALLAQRAYNVSAIPSSLRSRTMRLEAARNSFLELTELNLLGSVTGDGLDGWRAGNTSMLDRSLVGHRAIAESIDAVGDIILGPRSYCYLTRPEWTSLPMAIGHYLKASNHVEFSG